MCVIHSNKEYREIKLVLNISLILLLFSLQSIVYSWHEELPELQEKRYSIPLNDIRDISAGPVHTCVLLGNGSVSCWGDNHYGELGDGTTVAHIRPTQTSSLGTDRTAVAIAAGWSHTCAILDDGTVSCWGSNYWGQLGDGTTTDRLTPTQTVSLGTDRTAVAISAGGTHTCAILDDGSVSCWGSNYFGSLGTGSNDAVIPTQISNLDNNKTAVAIDAGDRHTCVILDDGSVSCWGYNNYGQIGDGTTNQRNTPTQTVSLGTERTAVAISAGYAHTCVILDDGSVSCWGRNEGLNRLGDDITTDRLTPTQTWFLGKDRTAVAISAGTYHTCAVLDDGFINCRGDNYVSIQEYIYTNSPTIKEEEIPLFVWVMVIIFLMLIAWGYDDEEIQTEKNKKVAKKEWEIPTHKKIFFGLWKRKLTGMEQLYAINPEIVYNHYSNKNNQENPIENKKVGIIDMVHTITNIRCTPVSYTHLTLPTKA